MSKPSRRPRAGRQLPAGAPRLLLPETGVVAAVRTAAPVLARRGIPLTFTGDAFRALADELGGNAEACAELSRLADLTRRPVFANVETSPAGHSQTACVGPSWWTAEKTRGFFAGMKDDLEALFGEMEGPPVPLGREAA